MPEPAPWPPGSCTRRASAVSSSAASAGSIGRSSRSQPCELPSDVARCARAGPSRASAGVSAPSAAACAAAR
eukprot:scaffold60730_cov75-Phaeocystis_antarctica.AAC.7